MNILKNRRINYRDTFDTIQGKKVLADLARFCGANTPSADVNNVNVTYIREGRREVYLRIMKFLNLSEEQLNIIIKNGE
jgi:hypothetical protein